MLIIVETVHYIDNPSVSQAIRDNDGRIKSFKTIEDANKEIEILRNSWNGVIMPSNYSQLPTYAVKSSNY